MKAVVAAFNQEKALVGAFSVIVQPVVETMDRFTALVIIVDLLVSRVSASAGPCSHLPAAGGGPVTAGRRHLAPRGHGVRGLLALPRYFILELHMTYVCAILKL